MELLRSQMADKTARRGFAEGLQRPGHAARMRENVSQALRESVMQSRPKLVEPVDYETFVVKNKVLLHNDPQRDMLNFPHDDVEVPPPAPTRLIRTTVSTVPANVNQEVTNLLVKECLKTYTSELQTVKFKYQAYAGSYQQLPNSTRKEPLQEHIFEIDAEVEDKDDDTISRGFSSSITKRGWLLKGPDSGKDNIISFTRQFKRRYFELKQQSDDTYVLSIYKDEKRSDSKGAIFLDLALEAVKNPKKGKYCFEIRMTSDRPPCLLAADNESEVNDWIITLNKVISAADTASQASRDSIKEESITAGAQENYKESQINHPVVKYCRETDSSLTKARQEARQNLFSIYPDMRRTVFDEDADNEDEAEIDVFPRQYTEKYLIGLDCLRFSLQLSLADEGKGNKKCNPEPFFLTFALYDAREGRKISEDFHIDPNEIEIRAMIPLELLSPSERYSASGKDLAAPDIMGFRSEWLFQSQRQGVFSIVQKHHDIYLVARIEKVLQGSITQCMEPYLKGSDPKMAQKVHRQMKQFCSHIGHYRMPFAWSAIPLSPGSSMSHGIHKLPLYRQEMARFSEEEMFKLLNDLRKPEKKSKFQEIPGEFRIRLYLLEPGQQGDCTLTPSLVPVKPFVEPTSNSIPTIEIEEFTPDVASLSNTFDSYVNNLYVRPMSLKFDSQKAFAKARNIACCIELRESDEEGAVPLKRIYGRPGTSIFTTVASTTVLHHAQTPDFMEEVKLSLPVQMKDKHHLFFRFYHVSCEGSKTGGKAASGKRKDNIEMPVGYAWMPLLQDGKVITGEKAIPVASHLPTFYLNNDTLSIGKSASSDVKWVDGGKPLFKLNLHLVSTIYTKDQHLHNFFLHCQKVEQSVGLAVEMNNVNKIKQINGDCGPQGDAIYASPPELQALLNGVKSLLAVEVVTYVQFLPTLLNQLFQLLSRTASEDVAVNTVRVLIHIVSEVHDAQKQEAVEKYVKYMFRPDPVAKTSSNQKTVHEELAKNLASILRPANTDPLVVTRFLKHAWFFFDVLMKSMTLYLIDRDRVKMPRNERFSGEYQYKLQNLLNVITLHIVQKSKDCRDETKSANNSLANFVKNCFTLMDRGYVFKLISRYIENFNPGDSKALHEFKFEFLRIVCSHEHFIPLSLPLMRRGMVKNFKEIKLEDLKHDYCLSDEYRKHHYLVGLLLFELRLAMTEQRAIRRCAITVLRNQLAKHSFDDRYASQSQQGRIAALYLPLIGVLLDSKNQLLQISSKSMPTPTPTQNGDVHSR